MKQLSIFKKGKDGVSYPPVIVVVIVVLAVVGVGVYFTLKGEEGAGNGATSAEFEVSNLTIDPREVEVGDPVELSVTVKNIGDLKGTYDVTIQINGEIEDSEFIMLAKGGTETVFFTVTENGIGTYDVTAGEMCPHCRGTGVQFGYTQSGYTWLACDYCDGEGWIDSLTGSFKVRPPSKPFTGTVTLYPIADSYVDSDSPTSNFGDFIILFVDFWDHGGTGDVRCNSYLMFDLSSIPSSSIINSAELKLLTVGCSQTTTIGAHYCPNNSWVENGITWNNAPAFVPTPTDTITETYGEWHSWDITSDMQSASSVGKLTAVLRVESTGDCFSTGHESKESPAYCSDPHGYSGPCYPRLMIDYTYTPKS